MEKHVLKIENNDQKRFSESLSKWTVVYNHSAVG